MPWGHLLQCCTCSMRAELRWICSAEATAKYKIASVGGGTHVVNPGDSLWKIAKAHYGYGAYWKAIAEANPNGVAKGGELILCRFPMKIPQIDVVAPSSNSPATIFESERPSKQSDGTAVLVCLPHLTLKCDKTLGKFTRVCRLNGMTAYITMSLNSEDEATKRGSLPASFNIRTLETELKNGAAPFESSIKIDRLTA